jgi:hypothetical protein
MLRYYNRQKKAKDKIKEIFDNSNNILIIHYSCESFYDLECGKTPRITSIAVKYLNTEIDCSFSIHKIAEIQKETDIQNNYDSIERKMLDEFYEFLKSHENYNWLHWNMKNINYGFEAIAHRYKVLGGTPYTILNEKTINLAKLLSDIYGCSYIKNPKLYNLIKLNGLEHKDLLNGEDEGKAFQDADYVKLHRSTLKKVDAIYNILNLAYLNKLKTNASFIDKNGGIIMLIPYLLKEHWVISTLLILIGFIASIIGIAQFIIHIIPYT